jgi:hypothetical protein
LKKLTSGANKKTVKIKAKNTPTATPLPIPLKGSMGAKLRDKNPMAVVIEVRKRGCKFKVRLSMIASLLFLEEFKFWKYKENKCTQSATAKVAIKIGTIMKGWAISPLIKPIDPIALATLIRITKKEPATATRLLKSKKSVNKITKIAEGINWGICALSNCGLRYSI